MRRDGLGFGYECEKAASRLRPPWTDLSYASLLHFQTLPNMPLCFNLYSSMTMIREFGFGDAISFSGAWIPRCICQVSQLRTPGICFNAAQQNIEAGYERQSEESKFPLHEHHSFNLSERLHDAPSYTLGNFESLLSCSKHLE